MENRLPINQTGTPLERHTPDLTITRATAAHGVAGGTLSKLQGGRFGHGLASAGIIKVASPAIEFAANDNSFAEVTMATIAGGTISSISGGKFANGAVTAAMAYAFGQVEQRDGDGVPDFDLESSEGRQQYAQWIWENRERFGIEVPDGTSFEYVDEFMMITPVGRVACDGPCQNIDYQRRIPMAGEYFSGDGGGLIRMYRGAFDPWQSATIQVPGGNPRIIGNLSMSPSGSAVWTLGHEAAHARGIDLNVRIYPHLQAEYHGYQAFRQYRSLLGR